MRGTVEKIPDVSWTFVDLYERPAIYIPFLYSLLQERLETPSVNISHKKMPEFREHVEYVYSQPYYRWYILANASDPDNSPIGSVYISNSNEIGIHIAKAYQRRGYGKEALTELLKLPICQGDMLANINPANVKSINLFTSLGFVKAYDTEINGRVIQETYIRRVYSFDE